MPQRTSVFPLLWTAWAISVPAAAPAEPPNEPRHVIVYREPGRFGGWPANHGIWSWGDEILVGFGRGYHQDNGNSHNIDHDQTEDHLLARSLEGGETWTIEDPSERGGLIPGEVHLFGHVREGLTTPEPTQCPGGIDFTHPDFAMTLRMFAKRGGESWFSYSYDRGRNWEGPFVLPSMGTPGTAARTNYLVNGRHDCTVFVNTIDMPLSDKLGVGQRPFCARTTDGGKTWNFQSWIGPPVGGNAIMPTVACISDAGIVCVLRRRIKPHAWLSAFVSHDDGQSWSRLPHPVESTGVGNPASLLRLQDGRLCVTYGVRAVPYRMCAKLSSDAGQSWTEEIVLRDDGGNQDMGYPRTVQRPDGKAVTVYYFWDKASGPERYIAATIWEPPHTH
ncbi:MAG: exo-alpha-sialidase [Planctomycetaceae bacterium]